MRGMKRKTAVHLHGNNWDSEYFGFKIGMITYEGPRNVLKARLSDMVQDALEKARKLGYKYLVFPATEGMTKITKIFKDEGFILADSGVDFKLDLRSVKVHGCTDMFDVTVANKDDLTGVKRIARTAFPLSRLYRLEFASKKDVDEYHAVWVSNLYKGRRSAVFAAKSGRKVRAFLAVSTDPVGRFARIVLIASGKGQRGKGAGSALMYYFIDWARGKGIKTVYVKTQKENVRAVKFYRKHGFKLYARDYKYHISI